LAPPYYSQRAVFASLSTFFLIYNNVLISMWWHYLVDSEILLYFQH